VNELSNQPLGPCPELESLAALADGHLGGKERERLLSHLTECERCYEIFEETMTLMEDLEEDPVVSKEPEHQEGNLPQRKPTKGSEHSKVLPFRAPHWPLAAGAALAAAAALVLILRPSVLSPVDFSIPALTPVLAAAGSPSELLENEDWATPPWPALRGREKVSENGVEDFRLGVEAVFLQLALSSGETAQARRSALRLEFDLGNRLEGSLIASFYGRLADRIEAGEDSSLLADEAADHAREIPASLEYPSAFNLGAWATAGWLASQAELADHFTSNFRKAPQLEDAFGQSLANPKDRLEEILKEGPPDDFEELTQRFESLLIAGGSPH
jgi:hypothetical protein